MIGRARAFETIRASAADIARVARRSPGADVPRYPGTNVEGLVRHVITIHEWVARIVDERSVEVPSQDPPSDDLVERACSHAFDNGHDTVHIAVRDGAGSYEDRGWKLVGTMQAGRESVTVFRRDAA